MFIFNDSLTGKLFDMPQPLLKLRAKDAEDVQVLSAVLQDSIAPVCDMVFQAEAKSFVMVVQRLRREGGEAGAAERICSALTVNGVAAIKTHGINLKHQERMLDLLAMLCDGGTISLIFAGDAKIRLELGAAETGWAASLEDFGEPWPALCHPCHDSAVKAS
jgi:hypothetical protein